MKVVDSSGNPCIGDDVISNINRLSERVRGRRRRALRKRSSLSTESGGKTKRRFIGKQAEKNDKDECASSSEIRDYLSKLHEIVPVSRKHKRLSRLQVLTNAIDYIRHLRQTLGLPPCISSPGQHDHYHQPSSYILPTSQSLRTNDTSNQQECSTKSEAHVWLVSMPYSPSYHHDNESSTSSSPAIP